MNIFVPVSRNISLPSYKLCRPVLVMSIDHYERLKAQVELFEKLGVAQAQSAAGNKGITHKQMMTKLRRRLDAK